MDFLKTKLALGLAVSLLVSTTTWTAEEIQGGAIAGAKPMSSGLVPVTQAMLSASNFLLKQKPQRSHIAFPKFKCAYLTLVRIRHPPVLQPFWRAWASQVGSVA